MKLRLATILGIVLLVPAAFVGQTTDKPKDSTADSQKPGGTNKENEPGATEKAGKKTGDATKAAAKATAKGATKASDATVTGTTVAGKKTGKATAVAAKKTGSGVKKGVKSVGHVFGKKDKSKDKAEDAPPAPAEAK